VFKAENATVLLLLVGLAALVVYFSARSDVFLSWETVKVTSVNYADLAVLAVPMALLMIAGGVDLSLGSTMALSTVVMALAVRDWGWPGSAGVLLALGIGAAVGTVNGLLCGIIGCNPVIVTIGGLFALRAIGQLIRVEPQFPLGNDKDVAGLEQSEPIFRVIGSGEFLGLPNLAWFAIGMFLLGGIFIAFTPWGRYIYAIGINRQAAYLSGLPVRILPFFLYVATGACAGLAGVLAASRIDSTDPSQLGFQREFYTLIVVLLGGVAWAGGRGKLAGVAVAVVFLSTLFQGLTLLDVNSFVQLVILGGALVVAALVDAILVILPGRVRTRRQVAAQVAAAAESPPDTGTPKPRPAPPGS
jgi:ribose/xylose/arabinose/galactoside ABC-type transport system permease subunit